MRASTVAIWFDPNDKRTTVDSDVELNYSDNFHDVHGLQCLPVKINYSS